jgi:sugar phosphate isomerase/epimerase
MATFTVSVNMEFVRTEDKPFEWGVAKAAELGYEYIEPMVHTGWELLSEVAYYHSFSLEEDPLYMKEVCDREGIKVASISGHSPLMKPEAAIPRLTRSILLAEQVGATCVNSDEMIKPAWMSDDVAHQVMSYTLEKVSRWAARHEIYVGIEPHGVYTSTADGLLRIVDLVPSPWIGVNWDTGNSYLAGREDPYEGLERVASRVVHVHAKDISLEQGSRDRGAVTGTPTGCACGEGVVDWERVLTILDKNDRTINLSVECTTVDEAKRSLEYLQKLVGSSVAGAA